MKYTFFHADRVKMTLSAVESQAMPSERTLSPSESTDTLKLIHAKFSNIAFDPLKRRAPPEAQDPFQPSLVIEDDLATFTKEVDVKHLHSELKVQDGYIYPVDDRELSVEVCNTDLEQFTFRELELKHGSSSLLKVPLATNRVGSLYSACKSTALQVKGGKYIQHYQIKITQGYFSRIQEFQVEWDKYNPISVSTRARLVSQKTIISNKRMRSINSLLNFETKVVGTKIMIGD